MSDASIDGLEAGAAERAGLGHTPKGRLRRSIASSTGGLLEVREAPTTATGGHALEVCGHRLDLDDVDELRCELVAWLTERGYV